MKIADLKQPYKRMAEYLVTQNYIQEASDGIYNLYKQGCVMDLFCNAIDKGHNPPITEEIKKHFPADFDFSGEDIKTKPVIQMLDAETQKTIYTQLAKEGKFDQLPDTCEFSDPVNLQVWNNELMEPVDTYVLGKFKGLYVTEANLCWQYAKLPTHKIDFLQFKEGDVVEVETISVGYMYGYIREVERDKLLLSIGYMSDVLRTIRKEKIKSITKIK